MTPSFKTPRTQNGIKRMAEQIAAAEGLPHMRSLERAAQAAGFHNWKKAQQALPVSMPVVRISVSWSDRELKMSGVESLSYPFPLPLGQLLASSVVGPRLAGLRIEEKGGQLTCKSNAPNQMSARGVACEAMRALMFIEATGLRPSKAYRKAYPTKRQSFRGEVYYDRIAMPGLDHESVWLDPVSRGYVIANEPYVRESGLSKGDEERQAQWCEQHGFIRLEPSWGGMYNPEGGTQLYLLTKAGNGIDLSALIAKINQLPDDFGPEQWPGDSEFSEWRWPHTLPQ